MKPKFRNKTLPFSSGETGAALVEYVVLTGLVSVIAIGAVISLGEEIRDNFGTAQGELADNISDAPSTGTGPGAGTGGGTPSFDWKVASTYPNPSECTTVGTSTVVSSPPPVFSSLHTPGETCYNVDGDLGTGIYSFAGASERHIYHYSVTRDDDGNPIAPSPSGSDILVYADHHTSFGVPQSTGGDNLHFINQSCAGFAVYETNFIAPSGTTTLYTVEFSDGVEFETFADAPIEEIYCGGDGGTITYSDIVNNAGPGTPDTTEPSEAGPSPYPPV